MGKLRVIQLLIATVMAAAVLSSCSAPMSNDDNMNQTKKSAVIGDKLLELIGVFFSLDEKRNLSPLRANAGLYKVVIPKSFQALNAPLYSINYATTYPIKAGETSTYIAPWGRVIAALSAPLTATDTSDISELHGFEISNAKTAQAVLDSITSTGAGCLVLKDIALTPKLMKSIAKMNGLRELWLFGVDFEQIGPSTQLPVKVLGISSAQPEDKVDVMLRSCPQVSDLSVMDVIVPDNALRTIAKDTHLRRLELANSAVTDDEVCLMLAHLKLETLSLHNTAISDASSKCIARQTDLVTLNLSRCDLSDAFLPALKSLKKLQTLDLAYTSITDKIAGTVVDKSLNVLGLQSTKITGACLPVLTKIKTLKKLGVKDNDLPIEPLRAFQKALPKCDVH